MVSLSGNWVVKRDHKSGDWFLEHKAKHSKKEVFKFSNRAAIMLAEVILAKQNEQPRRRMNKSERNRPQPTQPPEEFSGCTGQEWLDRVRPDVIDFTHALILAKEAGLKILGPDGPLSPYEAGVLDPTEVTIK